jgi:predicted phosphodiesterase
LRIRVLSDLHLEHAPWTPPPGEQDVVVLAGDIHRGRAGIEWAARHFSVPVLYVPGNHEYDFQDLAVLSEKFASAALPANVHILDDAALVVEGVRFLGTTLWSDFELYGNRAQALDVAARCMSDYARIRYGGGPLSSLDTLQLHWNSREWLQEALAQPFTGQTVVISHHCPHPDSFAPELAGAPGNPSMASDLTELMLAHPIALWIHGHTHVNRDHAVGATRIVCNPRGYARAGVPENATFNECLSVEI